MDQFYVRLGGRIRDARRKTDLTQEAVAERLSLSRTTFVNIEKGRQRLAVHQLVDLANALGCEAVELLNDDLVNADEFVAKIRSRKTDDPKVTQ